MMVRGGRNLSVDTIKFRKDVAWNLASLAVVGTLGVGNNLLIGSWFGPSALGVFNQVFAAFICASQLGALGIHANVNRAIAQTVDRDRQAAILWSAVLSSAIISAATTLFYLASGPWLSRALDSPSIVQGIFFSAPGLFLFAINKVLLAGLNGLRRMKSLALLKAVRFIGMTVAIVAVRVASLDVAALPVILSVSELLVLTLAVPFCSSLGYRMSKDQFRALAFEHLSFGGRGFLGGLLLELNTRVDVLMIGYFSSDTVVGIYSFASTLAEGFYQLLVVLRSNFNPLIAKSLSNGRPAEIEGILASSKRAGLRLAVAAAITTVPVYPIGVALIDPKGIYSEGWGVYCILVGAMTVTAAWVPAGQILLQGNRPGWDTAVAAATVGLNVVLNWLLIPLEPLLGAATATALSLLASTAFLVVAARKVLGIRL